MIRSLVSLGCVFTLLIVSLLAGAGTAVAQSRDIVEAAKKEGQLVFYSGMPVPDAQAFLSALEKKYPFLKTTFYRATGSALVSRIQTEQRAGTQIWDVMNSTGFAAPATSSRGRARSTSG